jgi:tetratricopeptide (TPR) repeat protein
LTTLAEQGYILERCERNMSKIKEGVYYETIVQDIGTGGTSRRQEMRNYYIATATGPDTVSVQLLDMDDKPLPIVEEVEKEDFERRFTHDPDHRPKTPTERTVDRAIAQAEAHARRKEYNSAEFEYNKAIKLDEENVRANFGLGKVYVATGETDKAAAVFTKLAKIEAVFEDRNKHIFNELGIELRRMEMYDQALEYYRKALSIAPDDENLYFNIARALYQKGDFIRSEKVLAKALSLNPDLAEAQQLMERVRKNGAA